jgi:nitrile hydratase
MDGIHDLGGRQGFGPIAVTDNDPAFPEEWEGRAYAMVQSVGDPGSTIDWFRHIVELLPPDAYMTEPYFQKWQFVQLIELLQTGMIELDEVLGKKPVSSATPATPKSLDEILGVIHDKNYSFERDPGAEPRFAVGDRVRTKRHMHEGHTRLPGYARDCSGVVIACHGGHALPDAGARGEHVGEHLYTVCINAREMWGDDANPRDEVTLDLWESYLV